MGESFRTIIRWFLLYIWNSLCCMNPSAHKAINDIIIGPPIYTHLFTFLNVLFKILKSGLSNGSSLQHFVIMLFRSSNVKSLLTGRHGLPYWTGPLFTSSIISVIGWCMHCFFLCSSIQSQEMKRIIIIDNFVYLLVIFHCRRRRMVPDASISHLQWYQMNKRHPFGYLSLADLSFLVFRGPSRVNLEKKVLQIC